MKRSLVILLLLVSFQAFSQTARFILSGKKVVCEICDNNKKIVAKSDQHGILDYCKQITTIEFKEDPSLGEGKYHTFTIGGIGLEFKSNKQSLWGKDSNTGELSTPVTIQPGDEIRINNEHNDFIIKIKEEQISRKYIIDSVQVSYTNNEDNSFIFTNKEPHKFKCTIAYNNADINISDIKVLINNSEQKVQTQKKHGKNIITYEVDPKNIQDTCEVHLSFNAKYKEQNFENIDLSIATISKDVKTYPIIFIIIACIFIGFIVYLSKRFFNRCKWNKATIIKDADNNARIRILCDNQPRIGDVADVAGKIRTATGIVYETSREGKLGKVTVKSISTCIDCLDNKSFDVNLGIQNQDNTSPHFDIVSDSLPIKLQSGMIAHPDGDFLTTNNYLIHISNNRIESILLRIYDRSNRYIDVEVKRNIPQIGDKVRAAFDSRIELIDGTIYEIANKRISKILTPPILTPEIFGKLQDELKQTKQTNLELVEKLKKSPSQEEYNSLKEEFEKVKLEKQKLGEDLKEIEKKNREAENAAHAKGKYETERKYKQLISEEYITLEKYNELVRPLITQKEEAIKAKEKAEAKVKNRDTEIRESEGRIENLKDNLQEKTDALIRQTAANAKLRGAAKKKNMHYLSQVQDVLSEISETFKDVYKDINNQQIRDGLISPMLRGVTGLSTGILSWSEDFSVKVIEESEGFFSDDFLTMSESDVKEILSKKFISNIVKSDSFSKFVRLYQLSTVPFIRKQLVNAQLNIAVLNRLYYKMHTLVTDFGYTIICPELFEEQYSELKYQWFNSTNLFTIIDLPEVEKNAIKEKGSETIIDINQIGFNSIWANRKATAVTPDF